MPVQREVVHAAPTLNIEQPGSQSTPSVLKIQSDKLESEFELGMKESSLASLSLDEDSKHLARAIGLTTALQKPWLWQTSPVDLDPLARQKLWSMSTQVSSFDIFFSHTWQTSGRQKYLSLLLQSGWRVALAAWVAAAALAFFLGGNGTLPLPFPYNPRHFDLQMDCYMGPWLCVFGHLATVLGLLLSPYIPRCQLSMCFLDVVSINQVDSEKKAKGVYGIGGFLSVSRELRILWSVPYMSRLWCVFEIAAYRRANPQGRITMSALFVETVAFCMWACLLGVGGLLWLSVMMDLIAWNGVLLAVSLSFSLPIGFGVHLLRRTLHSKHMLLEGLCRFDVKGADCRLEFDKRFVLQAIDDWYGGMESFNEYVRGPLQQELLQSSSNFRMPLQYYPVILTGVLGASLEEVLGLYAAGAPLNNVLAHLLGHSIGVTFLAVLNLEIMTYLSYRWAQPVKPAMWNIALSMLITGITLAFVLATSSTGRVVVRLGLAPSVFYCCVAVITTTCVLRGSRQH